MDPRYRDDNRALWDAWTELHARSSFYDVEAFRRGASSLQPIELEAMGPVGGSTLLHLQCHFGLDTLSWARLGARATGVDFSPRAIELARRLAGETGIEARFVQADLYELDDELGGERFDRVVTTYGVLWWLHDLDGWARVVARHLAPGGRFLLVEFHPLTHVLSDDGRRLEHAYFRGAEPFSETVRGSYAAPGETTPRRAHGWPHPLGEVVTALAGAGLTVDRLREFDWSPYRLPPMDREVAPGRYAVAGLEGKLPLVFSLDATAARGGARPGVPR